MLSYKEKVKGFVGMKKESLHKPGKYVFSDPVYYYILSIVGIIFLYISFKNYTQIIYENLLIIPCFLFLGAMLERKSYPRCKGSLLLANIMVAWFLFLQIKRSIERDTLYNVGLFLSIYLFAFPLASLLKDGDVKKALRFFAGAYLAAATVLAANGMLLVFDCLPAMLSEHVFWNGARLEVFWHPNIAACFFMIGIGFCTTFLSQAKSRWSKLGLCMLLVLIVGALALTSCRTATILTGGFLGALVFFKMIHHGKKWFLPAVLAVVVLTVGFYIGTRWLYQANYTMLIEKYAQQYSEQLTPESADPTSAEAADPETIEVETETVSEAAAVEPELEAAVAADVSYEEEYIEEEYSEEEYSEEDFAADEVEQRPFTVDPETGEIVLTTDSPQGSIEADFGTLNSRTYIWSAARFAMRENPSILYWGIGNPGEYVTYYCFFPIAHLHNAWMECLVGMGAVGFLIAVMFTLITLWNILIILVKHHQDPWKRNVALLTMCILVASVLEPYLFYTTAPYHPVDFLFFLCSGYMAHWQEADNRYIMDKIRNRFFIK